MKLTNTIKERILSQAAKIRKDLYGSDIEKVRRDISVFLDATEESLNNSESWIDTRLADIIESKHTKWLIGGILLGAFFMGVALGTNI